MSGPSVTLPADRAKWDPDGEFIPTCEREQFYSHALGRRRDLIRDHAELLEADFQNAKAAGEIPRDHPGDNEVEMQDVYAEMFYEAERLGLTRVAEAREREANLWLVANFHVFILFLFLAGGFITWFTTHTTILLPLPRGGGPNIDVCDSFLIQPRSKEDDSLVQRSDLPSEQWFFDEDEPDGNLLPTPALPRTGWTWTGLTGNEKNDA